MSKLGDAPQIQIPDKSPENRFRWKDWSAGFNTEDDPRDLSVGVCEELENFNIDKRGKLVEIRGSISYLSNVPAGLSMLRVFEYNITKPS